MHSELRSKYLQLNLCAQFVAMYTISTYYYYYYYVFCTSTNARILHERLADIEWHIYEFVIYSRSAAVKSANRSFRGIIIFTRILTARLYNMYRSTSIVYFISYVFIFFFFYQ